MKTWPRRVGGSGTTGHGFTYYSPPLRAGQLQLASIVGQPSLTQRTSRLAACLTNRRTAGASLTVRLLAMRASNRDDQGLLAEVGWTKNIVFLSGQQTYRKNLTKDFRKKVHYAIDMPLPKLESLKDLNLILPRWEDLGSLEAE